MHFQNQPIKELFPRGVKRLGVSCSSKEVIETGI